MEKDIEKNELYMYVLLNHFAVEQKLTEIANQLYFNKK